MVEVRMRRTPPPGFGAILTAARQAAGLGVREAARSVGIDAGHMSRLESEERSPSLTVARRLVEVLNLSGTAQRVVLGAAVRDAGRDHPAKRPERASAEDRGGNVLGHQLTTE